MDDSFMRIKKTRPCMKEREEKNLSAFGICYSSRPHIESKQKRKTESIPRPCHRDLKSWNIKID